MQSRKVYTSSLLILLTIFGINAQNHPSKNILAYSSNHDINSIAVESIKYQNAASEHLVDAKEILSLRENQPKKMILLDTRSKSEFDAFRIKDAKWIGQNISSEKIWMIDRSLILIIYTNTNDEAVLNATATKLKNRGFKDIRIYKGGIVDWINQGNPVFNSEGNETKKYNFDNKKLKRLIK